MKSGTDPRVLIAIIAAIASIVAAVISGIFAAHNRRLTAEEARQQAELNARRDYEYEARKRLYTAYEPLRFHMVDAAEAAIARIKTLFESARKGTLIGDTSRGYYLKATIYHLLAPCAIVRLMERNLTLVDLRLIPRIYAEYTLGKALVRAFTDDVFLAELSPALEYSPYVDEWREKRMANPQTFRRQGLPIGRLDNSLDALIVSRSADGQEIETLISFGEFEKLFDSTPEGDVSGSIGAPRDLFSQFHPYTEPVLWRILMTQMVIYTALLEFTDQEPSLESGALIGMLAEDIASNTLRSFEHIEAKDLVEIDPQSQLITRVKASIPNVIEPVQRYVYSRLSPLLSHA
jgi:hypothetical protein